MWTDTHTHLNDERLYPHWKEILQRARDKGVKSVFVVGYDLKSSKLALSLSKESGIYPIVGVHPHESENFFLNEEEWDTLITPKTLGIGEIGLDYYKMYSSKRRQKEMLISFICYAKKKKLPVIIHCRDAWEDLIDIIKTEKIWEIGGIMHSYSGSYENAKIIAEWNFLFSFSGLITYKNANNLREVLKKLPLDLIIMETDSPYLAPQSQRGKINEPANLVEIAEKIAEIKNIELETLPEIMDENLKRLFNGKL
ncbi:MAG TPA: TatD family hydrolase [Dictyoglomaceae bacterium]|nr:TatD family hydrolase [Dictyoglomaceae bacterium]HOL38841.1 TatD family hydrolase [Dictyoglomaceae bacterium]HOP95368.1 TatD family hydrolase [Dictyoglomaceae bacterium]HPP15742.1 TatD family hydrolase [Dictyoglomaceae bacterium]HPU44239.1 TatD family hydrolase [Dictyoglomaceae bacterium]